MSSYEGEPSRCTSVPACVLLSRADDMLNTFGIYPNILFGTAGCLKACYLLVKQIMLKPEETRQALRS